MSSNDESLFLRWATLEAGIGERQERRLPRSLSLHGQSEMQRWDPPTDVARYAPVDQQQPQRDQRHTGEMSRLEGLAERQGPEQDRAYRDEQRDQEDVSRAGCSQDTEIEHEGERGRKKSQPQYGGEGRGVGSLERPRAINEQHDREEEKRRGAHLTRGGGERVQAHAPEPPA